VKNSNRKPDAECRKRDSGFVGTVKLVDFLELSTDDGTELVARLDMAAFIR